MTAPLLHRAPRRRDVFAEQVRVVGLALRWPAIAMVVLQFVVALLFAIEMRREHQSFDFHPEQLSLPALVALLVPIGVWSRVERFGAGFFWTLPVDRREHALLRVSAGWVWLMASVALYVVLMLGLALASGDGLMDQETLHLLRAGHPYPSPGTLQPGDWQSVRWTPSPLLWLVPFTAATGAYVFASALALGVRHPLRWIIAAGLSLFALTTLGEAANIAWLGSLPDSVISPIVLGPYGLSTLFTARTEFLKVGTTLATGESVTVWRGLPNLSQWAATTLLWMGLGLAALWAAAHRHRERRRG